MITDLEPRVPGGLPPRGPARVDARWRIALAALMVFVAGAASAVSAPVGIIILAVAITVAVGWWARAHGDALVVAVALLVFWAPFHTTISQFNFSPQEVAVYFVLLGCLMLDSRGVWGWIRSYFTAIPRVSLIAVAIFALACAQAVALASGIGVVGRIQGLRSTLLYPLLFALLVAYTARTRRVERVVIQAFYGGAVLLAVYALTLKLWGVDIANGAVAGQLGAEASFLSQYHPNNIGLYLALALPFALPLWREAVDSRSAVGLKKAAIVVSALLLALDIALAASRGTAVALALAALVGMILLLWLGTSTQRAIAGSVVIGGLGGAAALVLTKQTAAFGRYESLLNPSALLASPKVQFRLDLYRRAYEVIKAHPLTGIGLQAFATTGVTPFSPHDTYLDLWVSVGIFGLLAFIFALGAGLWSSLRRARIERRLTNWAGVYYSIAITLALVAFFTQGFVETYDAQPRIAPVIWMLALLAQVATFRRFAARPTGAPAPVSIPNPIRRSVRPTPLIAPPPDDWVARPEWGQPGPASSPAMRPQPQRGANAGPLPSWYDSPDGRSPYPPVGEPGLGEATAAGIVPAADDTTPRAPAVAATHLPTTGPETPRAPSDAPSAAPSAPAARAWGRGAQRLAGGPRDSLAGEPPGDSLAEIDPQWDWDLKTGPLMMTAPDALPLIEESAFATSNITQATAIQRRGFAPHLAVAPSAPEISETDPLQRATVDAAEAILQRAPGGYIWNQIYSLLIFALSFVVSVIIARGLSAADFGVYTVLSSIVSVLLLLFAFGLEDTAAIFVPRLLASGGRQGSAALLRQMLILRVVVMLAIGALLAIGLPFVAGPAQAAGLAPAGFAGAISGIAGLRPALMGAYLASSAIIALQGAFFASVIKTRATLVIGGISQAIGAILTLAALWLGYGIDGIFAAQAIAAWAAALAFLVVLRPYLLGRAPSAGLGDPQVRSLMLSAWLTNISNGALGKQMDIVLMSLFAVSYAAIGFYNLAYQLVTIIGVLLISGLGGVSVAAMSVAYSARGPGRLISMWRAIIMLQLILVTPLQMLTFVLADNIIGAIYGAQYAPAATLLRIFLVFSFLGRFLGGGANQSALYVLDKQRIVLLTRWIGFALNLVLDVILIRLAGPAGALIATGFSQLWVGVVEFMILRRELRNPYPTSLAARVLVYALVAALPALVLPASGLLGLLARGAIFVVVFVGGALLFGLGDARDIVDLAMLNPRIQWFIDLIRRLSAQRAIRSRRVV